MSDERSAFDATVAALYETVLDPTHWDRAIEHVSRLFDAPRVALFDYDFVAAEATNFRVVGHDPQVTRAYAAYYHTMDPGRAAAMPAKVGEWLADEQLLDLEASADQEYVRDFALRSHIARLAGCKVAGDEQHCRFLSISRPLDAPRFGEAGRQTYRALEPHLRRVDALQRRIDPLASGQALARIALDRLQAAVFVLDSQRRVLYANTATGGLLAKGVGLGVSRLRLICSAQACDERLEWIVRSACGTLRRGGALRVQRPEASDLLVSILPIPETHGLAASASRPLALVVVNDPDAERVPADILRFMFALTPSEAALMSALSQGVSAMQWAQSRGSSIATVRTQLRSLFEKTGVDSQVQLVRLARSITPSG